jgi:hypothetical protein
LNKEDITNQNGSITSNESEAVIKSIPAKNSPEPDEFMAALYQTFKKELVSIFLNLFQEKVYEASITLIPKPDKDVIIS